MTRSMALTVFTKPWRHMSLDELAKFVKQMGFDGVELPVRPGYQVRPDSVSKLSEAVKVFADHGLKVGSIAGATDEPTMAACAEAGVPIIRICVAIPKGRDYLTAVAEQQRTWDALLPLLVRHGVTLGVQNHCGRFIANAMQLRHAIERYDPKHVCAVWDAAHNALHGEMVDLALDTVWSHLGTVNLKSARWRRDDRAEGPAQWQSFWTTGSDGMADWPWVTRELTQRGFTGDICLSAEYSDEHAVDRLIAEDVAFVKRLLAQGGASG